MTTVTATQIADAIEKQLIGLRGHPRDMALLAEVVFQLRVSDATYELRETADLIGMHDSLQKETS